jgi:hypothetical protein
MSAAAPGRAARAAPPATLVPAAPGRAARAGWLAAIVPAVVLLAGCALLPGGGPRAASSTPLPSGRVLVVARFPASENYPIADAAEALVLRTLRGAGDVVGSEPWLREATAAGAWLPAARVLDLLRAGGSPITEDTAAMLEPLAVQGVILVDVPTFEQIWGRYGKFTRVAVEIEAYQVSTRASLWRVRGAVEVEDRRGRAFQYALEEAVRTAVGHLHPSPRPVLVEFWRDLRR